MNHVDAVTSTGLRPWWGLLPGPRSSGRIRGIGRNRSSTRRVPNPNANGCACCISHLLYACCRPKGLGNRDVVSSPRSTFETYAIIMQREFFHTRRLTPHIPSRCSVLVNSVPINFITLAGSHTFATMTRTVLMRKCRAGLQTGTTNKKKA